MPTGSQDSALGHRICARDGPKGCPDKGRADVEYSYVLELSQAISYEAETARLSLTNGLVIVSALC